MQKKLKDRLDFEKSITDISTRLINIAIDQLDSEIKAALQQICERLGIDRCVLWQFLPDRPGTFVLTHFFVSPDLSADLPEFLDAKDNFPWCLKMMMMKKVVILPRVTDLPAEAARDYEVSQSYGLKSALIYPLYVGDGAAFGALAFNALKEEWDWPEELINSLQIVAQMFANVLNRKFIESNLRESEMRLKLAADAANAGLWSWDYKTGRIWVTDKIRQLYGFLANEEITAEKFFQTLHPDDLTRVVPVVEQVFQEGITFQMEYRIVLPDKSIHWIAVRAQGFLKPSGEPDRMTGVSVDITQQVKKEDDLFQLRLELAHFGRVMTINELSGSLAHEINQPLGAILNYASAAQILMAHPQDNQEQISKVLKAIIQDAKRAGDVIRKIRGMVKKEAAQFEPLKPAELIEDVIKLFQNNLTTNNIALSLELMAKSAMVNGDSVRLQQVLVNLITNALEAMKESPKRTLTIRLTEQGQDLVVVSIRDSGNGIDSKQREQIFDPFVTTKKEGLGFGLSICRSIIEEHGGKIWAENNTSAGATFSFSLKTYQGVAA